MAKDNAKKPPISLKKYLAVRGKAKTAIDGKTMAPAQRQAIVKARAQLQKMRTTLAGAGFGRVEKKVVVDPKTKEKTTQVIGQGISRSIRAWEKKHNNLENTK